MDLSGGEGGVRSRDLRGGGLMLLAAALYSLTPLAVHYAGAGGAPFLFNLGWRAGAALGFAGFLAFGCRGLFFSRAVWAALLPRFRRWEFWAVAAAYFDLALFAMAVRYVDVAAAVIVAALSPLFLVLVVWLSRGGAGVYRKPAPGLFGLMLLAFSGFALVALGESGGVSGLFAGPGGVPLWAGLLLALASAAVAALNGFSFRWGRELKAGLPDAARRRYGDGTVDLFGVVAAGLAANLAALPFSLGFGLLLGETVSGGMLGFSLVGGALLYPAAGVAWRKANLVAHNLGVNAIGYLRPALSLVWLAPVAGVDVARPGYLVVGVALVVLANVLIHWGPAARRRGFTGNRAAGSG